MADYETQLDHYRELCETAFNYGLDIDTMMTLAKSQISTVKSNCELQHKIEELEEIIVNLKDDISTLKTKEKKYLQNCESQQETVSILIKKFQKKIDDLQEDNISLTKSNIEKLGIIHNMARYIDKLDTDEDICKLSITDKCNSFDYDGSDCINCIIKHFESVTDCHEI
jgi:uncharacterized protein YhaN